MAERSDLKTVVVAEPDVLIRMVIAEYLRDCGYRVIEAVSSKDIDVLLEGHHIVHVVLADVSVDGDTGGFSVAARIRQTHPDVDVILTSGVAGAAEQSQTLCENGPIKKPYQAKDVESRIKFLLERRRASTKKI